MEGRIKTLEEKVARIEAILGIDNPLTISKPEGGIKKLGNILYHNKILRQLGRHKEQLPIP